MFARDYKKKGVEHLSTYLKTYKLGDIIDIKVRPNPDSKDSISNQILYSGISFIN